MTVWDQLGLSQKRVMIIHHDDLGYLEGINRAYFKSSFKTGSLIMPSSWSNFSAFQNNSNYDLGIHLTLTSDLPFFRIRPLTSGSSLKDPSGFFWTTRSEAWPHILLEDAENEFRAQIQHAISLGIDVTHIDSHQAIAFRPDILRVYFSLSIEFGIPGVLPEYFQIPGMPFAFRRVYEKFPELETLIGDSKFPKVRVIDTYKVPPETKRNWYIETLPKLPNGVYHLIHHAACLTPETEHLEDIDVRTSDQASLMDKEVQRVISEFVMLPYREVRNYIRV
jgi:predicted glycoside hydrolase/deacetylase ChbG (UPF0249 family)